MKKVKTKKTKKWFSVFKKIIKVRYKQPKFVYLGEEVSSNGGGCIISNHEGTDAPMAWELYSKKNVAFWGAYQMNSGLKKMYSYQTKVYYHEKKHWNLFAARAFCLLASPLTNIFYKGLNVISTYPDVRFVNTISESIRAISNGYNVVIFPEKSDKGYQPVMDGFHNGIVLFAHACLKKGIDLPIFPSYFSKDKNVYVIGEKIMFSELQTRFSNKEDIAKYLCDVCNELGKKLLENELDEEVNNQSKKEQSDSLKTAV